MEATPSLACANKCVFCWRHHTNPVGKSWQWKMDDATEIVNTAIELHTKMIKQMKGVPGLMHNVFFCNYRLDPSNTCMLHLRKSEGLSVCKYFYFFIFLVLVEGWTVEEANLSCD